MNDAIHDAAEGLPEVHDDQSEPPKPPQAPGPHPPAPPGPPAVGAAVMVGEAVAWGIATTEPIMAAAAAMAYFIMNIERVVVGGLVVKSMVRYVT